jgi:hypothetical protein
MATINLARDKSNNSIQRTTDVLGFSYAFGTGKFPSGGAVREFK